MRPIQLYDTLTQQKQVLRTLTPGHLKLYVCGPTVYDHAHLGHARSALVYDVLVRFLRFLGWKVTFVRNVTDIDDKILKRSREAGEEPASLSERFFRSYSEDMSRLGNLAPDREPKVSEHVDQILALIERLMAKGAAYVAQGDVYFRVRAFPAYGKLSGRRLEDLECGASGRTMAGERERKEEPCDFALWKGCDDGDGWAWDSPWGRGRPGWHIECSAMAMHELGETFDLHGGGLDLVFPHHENEIAQSEAATGKPLCGHWMHNGFVEVNREKMSKSLGNFFTLRDIYEWVEPEAVRYFMLTTHYRAPLNLQWDVDGDGQVSGFPQMSEAERRLEYLYTTRQRVEELPQKRVTDAKGAPGPVDDLSRFGDRLADALRDDLNTPVALALLSDFLCAVNEACDAATAKGGSMSTGTFAAITEGFDSLRQVLGVGRSEPQDFVERVRDRRAAAAGLQPVWVMARMEERAEARRARDFATADGIRDELLKKGVELLDSPGGTSWRML